MRHPCAAGVIVAAALLASSGIARSVFAQDTTQTKDQLVPAITSTGSPEVVLPSEVTSRVMPGSTPITQPDHKPGPALAGVADKADVADKVGAASDAGASAPAASASFIGFNFKDAPIDRVLDFFAREAGLPIIFEAPAPQGSITFVSSERYAFGEALSILNLNLARFGVALREQDRYLYLATIQDAMRRPVQVATPQELAKYTPDTIVTVGIPLDNARVEQVIEQVKSMIGPFGGALAVPTQNMLIVVESAAQVRRIKQVISAIDSIRPIDSAFQIFPLKYANPDAVLGSLQGLLGERQRTVIVDKDGKSRVVEEVSVSGINISADPRTNSIIAVGAQARIDNAKELIELLDVPATGNQQRELVTFVLTGTNADEAAQRVSALFAQIEGKDKPIVVPLAKSGKISILGSQVHVAQAKALVLEMDGGAIAEGTRTTAAIILANANATAAEAIVSRLLQGSLSNASRVIAGPHGRTLLVSGTDAEVALVRSLIVAIDAVPSADRDVRVLRLGQGSKALLERANALYVKAGKAERDPVETSLDESSGVATLVGSPAGLAAFDQSLLASREFGRAEPSTRQYRIASATPSVLAGRLGRLLESVAPDAAASTPEFDALDDLGILVVRAEPSRHAVIEELIKSLDAFDPKDRVVRVITSRGESAESLRNRTLAAMGEKANGTSGAGGANDAIAATQSVPTISIDPTSGALIISGPARVVERFTQVAQQLQQALGQGREVRFFKLEVAKAADIAASLAELSDASSTLRINGGPAPAFEAIALTNSVLVAASPQQLAVIDGLIKGLDVPSGSTRAPLRILRVQAADAQTLAGVIQRSFEARPALDKASHPVRIDVDPNTNTLIVAARAEEMAEIEDLVAQANEKALPAAGEPGSDTVRQIRIFPLLVARADDLSLTLEQMFPEAPTPIDPRTRQPRPDLRPSREVVVRADRATNSIIVDAVASRVTGLEEIIKQLDKPALARDVLLRTYRITKADLEATAESIRRLSASGALGESGPSGAVTVATEPISRTLMVSAPPASFEKIEALLKELNTSPESAAREVKLYTLARTRADRVEPMVRMLVSKTAQDAFDAAGVTLKPNERPAEITSDQSSNTLIISAPKSAIAMADGLIAQLDGESVAAAQDVRVVRLSKGNAQSVAAALAPALAANAAAKPITITSDTASNSVVIAGPRADVERAEALVATMDVSLDASGVGIRTILLKHARAEAVAPTIEGALRQPSMLDLIPDWQRYDVMRRGGVTPTSPIRAVADARTNSIVVSGPRALLDLAEQVAQGLDVSSDGETLVRVLSLSNADATELGETIKALFVDGVSTPGNAPAPIVRVDQAANAIIVRADAAQMAQVEKLVRDIDAAALEGTRQMRVIGIDKSRVDAGQLAQTLKRMLEQQGGAKVRVIDAKELLRTPESTTDKVAPASPESPTRGSMIQPMQNDMFPTTFRFQAPMYAVAVVAITQTQPPATSNLLQSNLAPLNQDGVTEAVPESDYDITIAVDPATNSLIVLGSDKATQRVSELAQRVQTQMPTEPTQVNVVRIPKGVDANAIAEVLRATAQQLGRTSQNNPGGLSGQVGVVVDPSGESIVLLAKDTDFETLRPLIVSLIQPGNATNLTVKVYPLSSTTADRAARALTDLFLEQPRGRQAQRVRAIDLAIPGPNGPVVGRIDPASIKIAQAPSGTSLIIAAPAEAISLIDRLIEAVDQSPVADRLEITRYAMNNARASELSGTLQELFDAQRQGPGSDDATRARFIADDRTNSLLVTASRAQHAEVVRVLGSADAPADADDAELALITLKNASPSTIERIVRQVIVGRDPAKAERIRISAAEDSRLFVVRAPKDLLAQVRDIIAQADTTDAAGLPVRSIALERANAQQVATALQQFFSERARAQSRPGSFGSESNIAIVGDQRSGTIVVAANDDDFATIQGLVKSFDAPKEARDLQLKVIPLKHADASQTADTLRNLAEEMRWSGTNVNNADSDVFIEANDRTNALVIMGKGEVFATVERVLATLDQPTPDGQAFQVAVAIEVKNSDVQAIRTAISRVMATPGWRSWRGIDPAAVTVEIDRVRRALIIVGKKDRVDQAISYIKTLDAADTGAAPQTIEAITLQNARADRAGQSLRQFFTDRARAQGIDTPQATILGSPDGNVIIVAGDEASIKTVRDLVAQIDQPDQGKDRRVEVFVLSNGTAADAANVIRSVFTTKQGADNPVVVTPQPSTNSLIVAAPEALFPQVQALLKQLDAPPNAEDVNIETVTLKTARAADVATALKSALPPNVKVTITPVTRSNTIILTGSREAVALAMTQVAKLDEEPVRSGLVFRRVRLAAGDAADVSFTLEQLLTARPRLAGDAQASIDYSRTDNTITIYAPADQLEEILRIITELDQPNGVARQTEFVKLEYARAEQTASALRVFYGRFAPEADTPGARRVTIIPDTVSNSLVIRADASQWEGIRALLTKLDTKEYDTSQQLTVIPLEHAEAPSVARALNEGFRAPIEEQIRRAEAESRRGNQLNQRDNETRTEVPILVDASSVPSVSAEPRTNSLVIFAKPKDAERIASIVRQLDVAGFEDMPAARIIPLAVGKPSAIAATIREVYLNQTERVRGPRATLVIGDDTAGALIVRADDERFAEVSALATALQQQGQIGRVQPHVVRLKHVSAARLRPTLLATFTETARTQGETIAIEIDRGSNTLVVACSARLLEQIKAVVEELDQPSPTLDGEPNATQNLLGDSLTIADVTNNDPAQIRATLEQLGVTRAQPLDKPGLVSEPVTLSLLTSRRAIAIAGSAADTRVVSSLIRALDVAPANAEQSVGVVQVKVARASALARTLNAMLSPAGASGGAAGSVTSGASSSPARALAEHVRRLSVLGAGAVAPDLAIDLTVPIRLIPDDDANILVIASNKPNVAAMREVVASLDRLPLGDAVLVRIFPLENASAIRVKAVLDGLFAQGDALRRLPGTSREALPTTATGQALASEIAISIDDRTNSLIVAAREEAVALVEVLIRDLDGEKAGKWIEPMVIPLANADAVLVADKLREILIRGLATTPDAIGLQRQYGRLRIAKERDATSALPANPVSPSDPAAPANPALPAQAQSPTEYVETDLFAPVSGLIITAQEESNSLLVIGTPGNNAAVKALVAQLDIPIAGIDSQVRMYPLKYAAADRVATLCREFFRQRSATEPVPRKADDVIITTDVRTNTLIVATSPRSFAILEGLLKTFDAERANFTVGMHVLPVKDVDVRTLAPRIERLMRERLSAAAQAGSVRNPLDAFTIEAEPVNNLLIISCSDENLVVIKELVAALTANTSELAASERVEIMQLTKARADEVATSIQSLYVEKELQRRGPGSVRVTANERLNALIVSGNEQDMIEIRALAARLDRAEVAAVQQIKWIPLKSANASEVVQLLQSVLAGRPMGGGRGVAARQATRVQFIRDTFIKDLETRIGTKPTETELDGAIRDQVTLTPDTRTNAIWITAPEPMMVLITEMIGDMESSSAGARKIEYYRLKNADARQMAVLLRDTFNLREQGRSLVLIPTGGAQDQAPNPAIKAADIPTIEGEFPGSSVTPVPDERMQLSVAIDARTNTLVVSGTEEYLTLVRTLVERLDSIEATERDRRVYHLRNAKAKDIETTLQSYFRGENDTERRTLGADQAGSLLRRLEEEVTVIGDTSSNKLVISTSPRYIEAVMEIVKELDSPPPQVMIQVLLAEVTLDQSDSWGMDVSVGPFGGEGYRIGTSAANAGIATSLGVPNLSVSSADFSLLVRALEAQGKLEVLSNPQVLANNNETARIQVGEDVPLVDGVERSSQGNSFANVRREKVGIILDVTPSISSDGFVRMEISPVISQLTQRTVQIAQGISSPIISERSVDTVVTVKDGQSVVIGGLIQTTEEQRRSKVPILGDIPILGLPFRTTQTSNVKTELLVILTPRVVSGQSEADVAKTREISSQAIDRLEDPSAIEDYLEQIKADIRRSRGRTDLDALVPSSSPAPLSSPNASTKPDGSISGILSPSSGLPANQPQVPMSNAPLVPLIGPLRNPLVDPLAPFDPLAPTTQVVPSTPVQVLSNPMQARPTSLTTSTAVTPSPTIKPLTLSPSTPAQLPDPDALGPLIPVPPAGSASGAGSGGGSR